MEKTMSDFIGKKNLVLSKENLGKMRKEMIEALKPLLRFWEIDPKKDFKEVIER